MPKTSTDHKFKRSNRSRTVMSRWVGSSELFWFWFFFPCIRRLRNRSKVQYLNLAYSPTDSTHFLLLDFVEMPFAVFRDQFFKSFRHPVCPLFLPITHSVHWIKDSWITKDLFKAKKVHIVYFFWPSFNLCMKSLKAAFSSLMVTLVICWNNHIISAKKRIRSLEPISNFSKLCIISNLEVVVPTW